MKRRSFVTGASLLGLPATAAQLPRSASQGGGGQIPRNVIFLVSDGMSAGVLPMAEAFSRCVGQSGTLWQQLLRSPEAAIGLCDMASLSSPVTDSAAASSSWGSGSRVFNGALNMLPDGTKLTPLAVLARDKGKRCGLVTTATVTHATPAGFAAVQKHRNDEHLIAPQYLDRVDVVLGGGRKFFSRDDGLLIEKFKSSGYAYAATRAELPLKGESSKILGLFDDSHLPYSLDQRCDPTLASHAPPLEEMTRAAIAALEKSSGGFLLQVEGARIDHAAHANDAAALLWEQLAFDAAARAAFAYAQAKGDTLLVLITDHGNANPGLNGMGSEYRESGTCFERLASVRCSYDRLGRLVDGPSAIGDALESEFGVKISRQEAKVLEAAMGGKTGLALCRQQDTPVGVLGQVLSNYTGIGWTGTQHTADFATVTAWGPGASRFAGLIRNVDVFRTLTSLMAVKFENPRMAAADARRHLATAPALTQPDWA